MRVFSIQLSVFSRQYSVFRVIRVIREIRGYRLWFQSSVFLCLTFSRSHVLPLRSSRLERGGGGNIHVIKIDFLEEPDCQLIIHEEHLVGGIHPWAEVFSHPPVTEITEN